MDRLNLNLQAQDLAGSAHPAGQLLGISNSLNAQDQLMNSSMQGLCSGMLGQYGSIYGTTNSLQQCGPWMPAKTAAGDFLKIQYAENEVRCAITRKMVPAGSPVMLLGGMVISQEAFENWLEEHLAGMIGRHQDLHTDNAGYDE